MPLDKRNKNIYMVLGWGSKLYSKYLGTSCSKGEQYHFGPMTYLQLMPLDTRNRYMYGLGAGISTVFKIFGTPCSRGVRTTYCPGAHDLHTNWCTLTQRTRIYIVWGGDLNGFWDIKAPPHMAISYIPCDVPLHEEQEYIWFRGGNVNSFWDIK